MKQTEVLKALHLVLAAEDDEEEEKEEEEELTLEDHIKKIKEADRRWEMSDAVEKVLELDPKALNPLYDELKGSKQRVLFDTLDDLYVEDRKKIDSRGLQKWLLDRIDKKILDDRMGDLAWSVVRQLEPDQELIDKVVMDTDFGFPYGQFEGESQERLTEIIEKSINENAIEAAMEGIEDSKVLLDFLKREGMSDLHDMAIRQLAGLVDDDKAKPEVLKEAFDLTKDPHAKENLVNHIDDVELIREVIEERMKNDPENLSNYGRAVDKLVENTDDPDFFRELAQNDGLLRIVPELLTKFDAEDLMIDIVNNEDNRDEVRGFAISRIDDQGFLLEYLLKTDVRDILDKGIPKLDKEENVKKIFEENPDSWAKETALENISDQKWLQKIVSDNTEKADIVRQAVKGIEDEAFLKKIVTDDEYPPFINYAAFEKIQDEAILKDLLLDEDVPYNIRRDIKDNHDWAEELAEEKELEIPEDDEDLVEIIKDAEQPEERKMLALRSVEDSSELESLFRDVEVGSALWDFFIEGPVQQDPEEFYDAIQEDADKVRAFIEGFEKGEDVWFIISDGKLHEIENFDYYEMADIAYMIYERSEQTSDQASTIMSNGFGGEETEVYFEKMTQDDLKDFANQGDGYEAQRAAGYITDQDWLKEAMDWGYEWAREVYWGIDDKEWFKDWLIAGGEIEDSYQVMDKFDGDQKILIEIYNGDDTDIDIRLRALEKIKDQEILDNAIHHKDPKMRLAALENYTKDQKLLEDFAVNDESPKVRQRAVKNLENQDLLLKIAYEDENENVAKQALRGLKDEQELEKLALEAKSEGLRRTAIDKLDPKKSKDVLLKIALEDPEVGENAAVRLKDLDLSFQIAMSPSASPEARTWSLRKIKDQDKLVEIMGSITGSKELLAQVVILLDGDHLPDKHIPLWIEYRPYYDQPNAIPASAKIKVIKKLERSSNDSAYKQIQEIIKTMSYRQLPEKYRPTKREITFDKPDLLKKDIKLHIPKANVQLLRLLLTMAR